MSENMNDDLIFAFLGDVRKKFIQTYDYDKISGYNAYQLTEFCETLKQLIVLLKINKQAYYNTNPKLTKTGEIIKDLLSAKDVMVSNIEKILDRDEKLNIIAMKSNNLNQHSKNIHYIVKSKIKVFQAANIKKQERMKNMKMILMIAAGVAVFLVIIFILVF